MTWTDDLDFLRLYFDKGWQQLKILINIVVHYTKM